MPHFFISKFLQFKKWLKKFKKFYLKLPQFIKFFWNFLCIFSLNNFSKRIQISIIKLKLFSIKELTQNSSSSNAMKLFQFINNSPTIMFHQLDDTLLAHESWDSNFFNNERKVNRSWEFYRQWSAKIMQTTIWKRSIFSCLTRR